MRGCDHFQMHFFCGCINQIVVSNSRLPPWKFKRLQTTLRPSKPTASQYVVVSEQATEHCWMLNVNIKAELNILPSDSLVNRCLVYIVEASNPNAVGSTLSRWRYSTRKSCHLADNSRALQTSRDHVLDRSPLIG